MINLNEGLFLCTAMQEGNFLISGFMYRPLITIWLLNRTLYHISTSKAIGLEPFPGNNLEELIPAGTAAAPGTFINAFQKFAKKTSFFTILFTFKPEGFGPGTITYSSPGYFIWGCRAFTDDTNSSLEAFKMVRKTFLGCGRRPLFEKIIFQQQGFLSYFLNSKVLYFGYTELLSLIFDFCPCLPGSAAAHIIKKF